MLSFIITVIALVLFIRILNLSKIEENDNSGISSNKQKEAEIKQQNSSSEEPEYKAGEDNDEESLSFKNLLHSSNKENEKDIFEKEPKEKKRKVSCRKFILQLPKFFLG